MNLSDEMLKLVAVPSDICCRRIKGYFFREYRTNTPWDIMSNFLGRGVLVVTSTRINTNYVQTSIEEIRL